MTSGVVQRCPSGPEVNPESLTGDILTIKQLSDYLMVSEKTIYRMMEKRQIPAVRVGSQWRFRRRDIEAWRYGRADAHPKQGQPQPHLDDIELDYARLAVEGR